MASARRLPFSEADFAASFSPRLQPEQVDKLCRQLRDSMIENGSDPGWVTLLQDSSFGTQLVQALEAVTATQELDGDEKTTLERTVLEIAYFLQIVSGEKSAGRFPLCRVLLQHSLTARGEGAESIDLLRLSLLVQRLAAIERKDFEGEVKGENLERILTRFLQWLPDVAAPELSEFVVKVVVLVDFRTGGNVLQKALLAAGPVSGLSETIVTLLNRPVDESTPNRGVIETALLLGLLGFISQVLRQSDQVVFYTNDIRVIYDILLRRLGDDARNTATGALLDCATTVTTCDAIKATKYRADVAKGVLAQLSRAIDLYPADAATDAQLRGKMDALHKVIS